MNKANRELFECILYLIGFIICVPNAVLSCERNLYEIMYIHIMGALITGGMFVISLICFIKEAVSNAKKRGE